MALLVCMRIVIWTAPVQLVFEMQPATGCLIPLIWLNSPSYTI